MKARLYIISRRYLTEDLHMVKAKSKREALEKWANDPDPKCAIIRNYALRVRLSHSEG